MFQSITRYGLAQIRTAAPLLCLPKTPIETVCLSTFRSYSHSTVVHKMNKDLIASTIDSIPGKNIKEVLGVVSATSDLFYGFPIDGMLHNARELNAHAVVGVRFVSCKDKITCYGTAVRLEDSVKPQSFP